MTAGEAGKGATEFLAAVDYLRNALTSCLVGKTAQRVQDRMEEKVAQMHPAGAVEE